MSDDFTDEELMAYADGEMQAAKAARLADLLPQRPDLARRIALFVATREASAESVRAHLGEPVPGGLKASVEDMIRNASSATVTAMKPAKAAASRQPFRNWALPMAASVLAVISGAIGYWIATQNAGSPGFYEIAAAADPELARLLSSLPAGKSSRLASSGAEIAMISSFHRGDQALCREFRISRADMGNYLVVACHGPGKWGVDFAMRIEGGVGDGYRPASSAETLDAYLEALGAGPALEAEVESDALGKLR
ncbi:anti-sigma factor family protein [Taklimakanibacter lacteus]|uniref:anti-sigma factor family protein n=1 Tax=Taklimakanibacter lacteus TaxID=2268456 RepID=UPI000E66910E